MLKRLFHAALIIVTLFMCGLLFNILTVAPLVFESVPPVYAHSGTPDSDGDGVDDGEDNCPAEPGEPWNGGCPYFGEDTATPAPQGGGEQQGPVWVPPTEVVATSTPLPTATINPVTGRIFLPSDRDTVLALLSNGGALSDVEDPLVLDSMAGDTRLDPMDVIEQLQALNLLDSAEGLLAVRQNLTFLNGRGDLFLTLGSNYPSENFVLHSMLSLTSNDLTQFEMCSVSARVERDGARNAQTLLDIGMTNNGAVVVIDRTDPTEEATITAVDLGLALDVPHHFLAVGNGETLNLFVDGEQVISELPVAVREGVFGLSLVGRAAPSPRCEGEDFWVFTF
jgi:hypothetical protein